jgi:WD40 repeat protein
MTLRVWDAESGSIVLGPLLGHTDSVTSVGFSPDGTRIISSSFYETLLWDAESAVLTPHSSAHNALSFELTAQSFSLRATSSDNGWVVDSDGRMVLWIPAHLRGDSAPAALHDTTVVWFNANRLPIIVNGFGLSWWSRDSTL